MAMKEKFGNLKGKLVTLTGALDDFKKMCEQAFTIK